MKTLREIADEFEHTVAKGGGGYFPWDLEEVLATIRSAADAVEQRDDALNALRETKRLLAPMASDGVRDVQAHVWQSLDELERRVK